MKIVYESVSDAILRIAQQADLDDRRIAHVILGEHEWTQWAGEVYKHTGIRPTNDMVNTWYGVEVRRETSNPT